jgi:hypothetical protein
MRGIWLTVGVAALSLTLAVCSKGERNTPASTGASDEIGCVPQQPDDLAIRLSPYDSVKFSIRGQNAQVCYGRPAARGRTMLGDFLPYGQLWRTGANEPTIIHLSFAAKIAGIPVTPGSYSIYTVPTATDWTVVVNRSITQWGHENRYTDEVKAQEAGRAVVPSERLTEHVEMFTIRTEPVGEDGVDLLLEWENTRVRIPIVAN